MSGPLTGVRVVEIAGIGPGPFCSMMLADMGAQVLRVQRHERTVRAIRPNPVAGRGTQAITLDLKSAVARDAVFRIVESSDVLIEGFRPGVMERLGLGPEDCMARNPRLIYGRMTGWGQHGPLAQRAGHDINYIALTGILAAIGTSQSGPVPPLNLVGDFGGGGMMLAFGITCALFETGRSGKGQVIDAAMTDGASLLMATTFGQYAAGRWSLERENNLLDGAAPFYTTYRCADGKWIAVGAIEPQFYAALIRGLGLELGPFEPQHDRSQWAQRKQRLAGSFSTRARDDWCAMFDGVDACISPVLDMAEALEHPHHAARETFINVEGSQQPAPAPRFSRTVAALRPRGTLTTQAALASYGFTQAEIGALTGESHEGVAGGD